MLHEPIKELLRGYFASRKESVPGEDMPKIHVDEIASQVAVFYEKVRNLVDYQEEHLFRKKFIDRVLQRRLFIHKDGNVAEPLIKEIIRSGHLSNDAVPEAKIQEVQRLIDNLGCVLAHTEQEEIVEWLTKITVNAIEESLFPPTKDKLISDLMFVSLKDRLSMNGSRYPREDIEAQLFIAIQKALLKVDKDQLHYRLFKFVYPDWHTMQEKDCPRVAGELPGIKAHIEKLIAHPLAPAFFKLCNHYNTVFFIVGDIIEDANSAGDAEKILDGEEAREAEARHHYRRRYRRQRSRLTRLAFFSVVSFFLSKIAVALAVEIPIETYLFGGFSLANTLVNIAFPPFLMLIIVLSIRMPSARNEELVVNEMRNALSEESQKKYAVKPPRRRMSLGESIARFSYFGIFFVVLYFLSKLLLALSFNIANIIIFVFFTSLVAAAGVKVNNRSKEISLEERKGSFLAFLLEVVSMPLVTIGKWILAGLAKVNILVIIFNVILELPFQLFIEFVENFRGFIKTKREEIT
ncbi:MAG: hypothetical protein HY435_01380 [Candidatus Liptonbacteria bacterium]|nr:hypothetical protein [Candidatus Liptonbacteria bacterium]